MGAVVLHYVTLCNALYNTSLIKWVYFYVVGSGVFHWSRYQDGGYRWNDRQARKLVSHYRSHNYHMTSPCIIEHPIPIVRNGAIPCKTPNFSSYHRFKAVRASDFILGLWAHQAFCFTNPTFKAVDSLLSEGWSSNQRYKTTDFQPWVVCMLATPTQEMGRVWNSYRV